MTGSLHFTVGRLLEAIEADRYRRRFLWLKKRKKFVEEKKKKLRRMIS